MSSILTAELIGLRCTILSSSNRSQINLSGTVLDETRNTLTLDIAGRPKIIEKQCCTFLFQSSSGPQKASGSRLLGRPEDRIKKNASF